MTIHYQITPLTAAHIYQVKLTFIAIDAKQQLSLPVWIPGSYMVREFSKNIIQLSASSQHKEILAEQITKNQWQLSGLEIGTSVEVSYEVYAYEYGIRTAFLDASRGYFNPTSLCLMVNKAENSPHQISFSQLPNEWQCACGLEQISEQVFSAKDYDELLDSPFELGIFQRLEFNVADTPHYLILSGTIPNFDVERIISDMQKICDYQIKMFDGVAPYKNYSFILNLSGEIYTGLEHRNSTLLMAPWHALPNLNHSNDEDYHKLLGLISHEFFHTWNVKRIKPQVFVPYQLEQENYTKLLWWFEGVTSYYDDLILYRSGIYNQVQYLTQIVENINNVYKFNGVKTQTLANSSLTSWIKYYRQDENSPNTIVSYYVKGSLVALCLDLIIRTQSAYSLDDVMRYLFREWQASEQGVGENELPELIKLATGVETHEFIKLATETTAALPLIELLSNVGLNLVERIAHNHQATGKFHNEQTATTAAQAKSVDIGAKLEKQTLGYLVKNVYTATPAERAGLAAGDLLLAINQVKLTNLEKQLSFFTTNETVNLSLFRQDKLQSLTLKLETSAARVHNLALFDEKLLQQWL